MAQHNREMVALQQHSVNIVTTSLRLMMEKCQFKPGRALPGSEILKRIPPRKCVLRLTIFLLSMTPEERYGLTLQSMSQFFNYLVTDQMLRMISEAKKWAEFSSATLSPEEEEEIGCLEIEDLSDLSTRCS